jgi:hypothetical protein
MVTIRLARISATRQVLRMYRVLDIDCGANDVTMIAAQGAVGWLVDPNSMKITRLP